MERITIDHISTGHRKKPTLGLTLLCRLNVCPAKTYLILASYRPLEREQLRDLPQPNFIVLIERHGRGSVPEIIEPGITGFIVEDETSAVAVADRIAGLDRVAIRKRFEERFTARRMALDYLAAYRGLMEQAEPRIKLVSSAE